MKHTFYPSVLPDNVDQSHWQDWQWQLRQSPKDLAALQKWMPLLEAEKQGFQDEGKIFSFRVTPYYLSLINQNDEHDPIRKIALPTESEFEFGHQALLDPLGEQANNPAPRIIHRYSDRVLFLVTDFCSVYCRYCTRKHFTGQEQVFPKPSEYQAALDYIKSHPGICEVILSGGDPLTLSDAQLEKVLTDLRSIEHVEIIRLGTRMPVVCPMRVTPNLVKMLHSHKPVYLMTHFNHPRELTLEAARALELFIDHGVPVFNQMVLLNGVNNHPSIIQALCRRLVYLRVKPYYLFQCDPSQGTDHLRTPIAQGEAIVQELWGHLSGLAMPIFSLDIPDGGGKTTLVPNFEIERQADRRMYKGWDGKKSVYIDPNQNQIRQPSDWQNYQQEWDQIRSAKNKLNTTVESVHPPEKPVATQEL